MSAEVSHNSLIIVRIKNIKLFHIKTLSMSEEDGNILKCTLKVLDYGNGVETLIVAADMFIEEATGGKT